MMNAEELQAIKLLQSQMHEIHTDVSRQLQICWQQVQAARRECADTRDRIEHLIERVQSLERKINALADAEAQRRDDIQQAIRNILNEESEA
jgi:polyhydroxyalkanoate synthesis regulator phasin